MTLVLQGHQISTRIERLPSSSETLILLYDTYKKKNINKTKASGLDALISELLVSRTANSLISCGSAQAGSLRAVFSSVD